MLVTVPDETDKQPGETVLWLEGVQPESEEELNTVMPCFFTEALNFMKVSYEEALKI